MKKKKHDMEYYDTYCTVEQSLRAYGVGAKLAYCPTHLLETPRMVKIPRKHDWNVTPTHGQMIGWLRKEKHLNITVGACNHVVCGGEKERVVYMFYIDHTYPDYGSVICDDRRLFETPEEAESAAIDCAIDYLEHKSKETVGADKNVSVEFVDLGLPSGNLWASCNYGAERDTDFGAYTMWGETPKTSGYPDTNDGINFNKYTHNGKTVLEQADDIASVVYAGIEDGTVSIPTTADFSELLTLKNEWMINYKGSCVSGRMFTGSNGNTIFLPAAGLMHGSTSNGEDLYGDYWTSCLNVAHDSTAHEYSFSDVYSGFDAAGRLNKLSIRAVVKKSTKQ